MTLHGAGISRRRLFGATAAGGLGLIGAGLLDPAVAAAQTGPTVPADFPGLSPFDVPAGVSLQSQVPGMIAAFDYSALTAYGAAAYHATEVGEVSTALDDIAATVATMDPTTPFYDVWVDRFIALAQAAYQRATQAGRTPVTARSNYLRASFYYGQALFYVLGTTKPLRENQLYSAGRDAWNRAARLLTPEFMPVAIPYGGPGGPLPGYLALAPGLGRKPTIIMCNGSDGQLIDTYVSGGAAALERGYNVLLFEGPGQGSMLFERNVFFRPDWNAVISPIVDFLSRRSEVDTRKIALTGISFGGGLVLQAASAEPRLRAVVSDPGSVTPSTPFNSLAGITNAQFQAKVATLPANEIAILKSVLNKRAEIFGTSYRADALAGKLLDITGLVAIAQQFDVPAATLAQVKMPALVVDYQFEQFYPGQSSVAFAGLTNSPGKQLITLGRADGAQLHDAPMAPQRHNEVILDWLAARFA